MPPWADPGNPEPSPPADPRRFRQFRTELGRFAVGGDAQNLHAALGHFARTASGGAAAGARRTTSMMAAGASAFSAFGSPGGIAAALAGAGVDLASLRGADLNTVIEAIARAFAPDNADGAKVEEALRAALDEVLQDVPDFDVNTFQGFDEDTYVNLIAAFIESCVLQQILTEAGPGWDRAGDAIQQQSRENALRETIRAEIGNHLQPLVDRGIMSMTRDQLTVAQVAIVAGVLGSWEAGGG